MYFITRYIQPYQVIRSPTRNRDQRLQFYQHKICRYFNDCGRHMKDNAVIHTTGSEVRRKNLTSILRREKMCLLEKRIKMGR